MNNILISTISFVIGAILTYIIGPIFSERFKLKTELAKIYLAPFRKWCYEFYGELDEFNRRYIDYSNVSDIQIIDDYRMIHETLVDAPRWASKIEKERKTISNNLNKLIDTVDRFWHNLEDQYNLQLLSRMDIIKLDRGTRYIVAGKIRQHLNAEKQSYLDIPSILSYLSEKKIP